MKKLALFMILIAFIATGCARSVATLDEAYSQGEGVTKTYDIDLVTAKKLAKEVLLDNGFEFIQDEGSILKTFSGRTYFLVELTPVDNDKKTKVRAISKRKFVQELTTTLTETGFFNDFEEKLFKTHKK